MGADTRAWVAVFDALKPKHPKLKLRRSLLAADVRPTTLKRYYDRALLAQGWHAASLPTLQTRRAWASGYERDGYVFAVVGLNSSYAVRVTGIPGQSGAVSVLPLNILTDVPIEEETP
ncbi:hypothetical protein V3W47_02595 [Deinococcus sp. YIM 134068]|uniref:hypothetical protein n=1 Tax=Deinococcus lichenicola TaxID=3118910 RepID=UPI002F921318